MNGKFTLYLFLFLLGAALSAQAQTVTISNLSACAGQEVLIPVTAANMGNIGAITLFIGFDTTKVRYVSLDSIDPQLSQLNYNYIANPPQVAVAWSNLTAANFPQTKIFNLRFHILGEPASIVFKQGCEISNASLQIVPATYSDGIISSADPLVQSQPQNITIHEGMNASFSTQATNVGGFRWKESRDHGGNWYFLADGSGYTGTHSSQLTILSVPLTFNGFLYQCFLSNGACTATSDVATLNVDSILFVNNIQTEPASFLRNQPNPFSEGTKIEYNLSQDGTVHLEIFNIFGQEIFSYPDTPQRRGLHNVIYKNPGLQKGLYLCKLEFYNDKTRYSLILKMIKE